jgi:lysophospholipase L1-like esterase
VKSPFDRLPARAEALVRPPVWNLSHNSAGLYVNFRTNAPRIAVRWTLNSQTLSLPHMPATGVSGVDLYVRNDDGWHFLANGQAREFPDNEAEFAASEKSAEGDVWYRLYLPLYNGVKSVEIGVPEGSEFGFYNPKAYPPQIVVYGTSITQGGCAARPGMAYPSILGRRLDAEFINLGFSGNGQTEPELATLLAELAPAAFVIDSLPNLTPEMLAERMPKFIEIIRERHPRTPILLVQNPLYPTIPFVALTRDKVTKANEILAQIYADRVAAFDQQITLVPACDLAADGGETTVDGVHPTDVGFLRLADALEPYLKKVLAHR